MFIRCYNSDQQRLLIRVSDIKSVTEIEGPDSATPYLELIDGTTIELWEPTFEQIYAVLETIN
jgi:hypothetical protein